MPAPIMSHLSLPFAAQLNAANIREWLARINPAAAGNGDNRPVANAVVVSRAAALRCDGMRPGLSAATTPYTPAHLSDAAWSHGGQRCASVQQPTLQPGGCGERATLRCDGMRQSGPAAPAPVAFAVCSHTPARTPARLSDAAWSHGGQRCASVQQPVEQPGRCGE